MYIHRSGAVVLKSCELASFFQVAAFWVFSFLCGFSDFVSIAGDLEKHNVYRDRLNFCEFIWVSPYQDEYLLFAVAGLCLTAIAFFYGSLFCTLRRFPAWERQRIKRSLLTSLFVLSCFLLCWLPMFILEITLLIRLEVNPLAIGDLLHFLLKADQHLYNLLLFNSFLDPLIFSFRLPEVRGGCSRMLPASLPGVRRILANGSRSASQHSLSSLTTATVEQTAVPLVSRKPAWLSGQHAHRA